MSDIIQVNPLVFGGEGESVHANMLTKLWENPNPSAAFAAQNIDLSSDDYDLLLIEWAYGTGTPLKYTPSVIVPKGQSVQLNETTATSNGVGAIYRNITYVNDTRLQASDCFLKDMTNTAVAYNTLAIPAFVYGLKKSLDITAIVSNVSTDASKCMLSDGVTSVEEIKPVSVTDVLAPVASDKIKAYKRNGVVTVIVNGLGYSSNLSVDTNIFNLGSAPYATSVRFVWFMTGGTPVTGYVDTSGKVYLNGYTTAKYVYGEIVFISED